jgi:hypothetical protein
MGVGQALAFPSLIHVKVAQLRLIHARRWRTAAGTGSDACLNAFMSLAATLDTIVSVLFFFYPASSNRVSV